MSYFIKLSTMEYPIYEGHIRNEHPEITDDQTGDTFPIPEGYAQVQHTEPPEYDRETQYISFATPVQIDGEWYHSWVVKDFTPLQIEHRKNRPKPTFDQPFPPKSPINVDGSPPNVIE